MDTDTTKAMQDALQAAVTRMNNGTVAPPEAKPSLMETIGPFLPMLPKLLENLSAGGEVLRRIETIQKNEIASIRDQVQILRKQCHHILKAQEQVLERVHEIQRQQVAATGAVLDLAQQMARVTFVDGVSGIDDVDDEDDNIDDFDVPAAPTMSYRSDSRTTRKSGTGRRQREA